MNQNILEFSMVIISVGLSGLIFFIMMKVRGLELVVSKLMEKISKGE